MDRNAPSVCGIGAADCKYLSLSHTHTHTHTPIHVKISHDVERYVKLTGDGERKKKNGGEEGGNWRVALGRRVIKVAPCM